MPEAWAKGLTLLAEWEERKTGLYDVWCDIFAKRVNAKYLGRLHSLVPFSVFSNKKITKVEDFKGLKMRVMPLYIPALKALGATPVTIPPTEIYTAMERGVVDGFMWPNVGMISWGLQEVTKYQLKPGVFAMEPATMMNLKKWNQIPKDLQEMMMEVMQDTEYIATMRTIMIEKKEEEKGVVLTKTLTVSKYYFLLFIALAVIMGSLMEVSIGKLLISGVVPGLLMAAMYHVYGLYCGTLHAATEPRAGLFSGEGLLVGKDYFPCQTRIAFRHHYLCGNRSDLRGSGHAYRIGCDGGCGHGAGGKFSFPEHHDRCGDAGSDDYPGNLHGTGLYHDDHLSRVHAHCAGIRVRPHMVRSSHPDQYGNRDENAAFRDGSLCDEGGGAAQDHHAGHLPVGDAFCGDRRAGHAPDHDFSHYCHGASEPDEILMRCLP